MIRRYSRDVMRQIWTEENKFRIWLEIEILACEARRIPAKDLATIRRRAAFTVERINEIEKTTNHDVIAELTGTPPLGIIAHAPIADVRKLVARLWPAR